MERKPRKGFGGRPKKHEPEAGEKVHLGIRVTLEMKGRLEEIAAASGRSQSQEAEIRLARSFDREDLLTEVLTLAYGREAAGLLMALGLLMVQAGEFRHVESGAAADGIASWTDNPETFASVTHAVVALLDAAKPDGGSTFRGPGRGIDCATDLIKSLEDPNERSQFTAHSRAAVTIRALLGPIAERMISAVGTRSIVTLDPVEQTRKALVADVANVLSALIGAKIRLHETGLADSPVPSRQEVFDALEKRFPVERASPAEQSEGEASDRSPPKHRKGQKP